MRSITSVSFFTAHNWPRLCRTLYLLHDVRTVPTMWAYWLCLCCLWKLRIKTVWNSHSGSEQMTTGTTYRQMTTYTIFLFLLILITLFFGYIFTEVFINPYIYMFTHNYLVLIVYVYLFLMCFYYYVNI